MRSTGNIAGCFPSPPWKEVTVDRLIILGILYFIFHSFSKKSNQKAKNAKSSADAKKQPATQNYRSMRNENPGTAQSRTKVSTMKANVEKTPSAQKTAIPTHERFETPKSEEYFDRAPDPVKTEGVCVEDHFSSEDLHQETPFEMPSHTRSLPILPPINAAALVQAVVMHEVLSHPRSARRFFKR